jgi:hypothetical protein
MAAGGAAVTARRLLWLVPALSLALGVAANVLLGAVPSERLPKEDRLDAIDVLFSLGFVVYAAVGALIVARHPRNAVGWLFCAFGVVYPAVGVLWTYSIHGLHGTENGAPGQQAAAWVFAWLGEAVLMLVVLLLLLFPHGRFLSRGWRLVGIAAVATAAVLALAIALDPGPIYTAEEFENPLGVEAAGSALETVRGIVSVAVTAFVILAGVSLILRFRRAGAREREQVKWFAAGTVLAVALVAVFSTLELTAETERGLGEVVTSVLALLSLSVIPISAGIAILRSRLYDIDVVINRTLVYGALTAALVGAYVASVLLLQLALSPLTEESDLAIAGSTLAVAALFRPLRGRFQRLVDRRFYRGRYDAARTLERFGARVRDEVDLDALGADLRTVVADTVQPAHVSLWLRVGPS